MEQQLTPTQYQINQWIWKLDDWSRRYEAEWGVGRLPELVSDEMREKWYRQWNKLNDAIARDDLMEVKELSEGCIRAWASLADAAMKAGHQKYSPDVWECRCQDTGVVYRFVRCLSDAHAVEAENTSTWTIEEVVRILSAKPALQAAKDEFPGARIENVFVDDDIPF